MDTPNSGFQLIHKFPIDILAGIALFVPGEDIGRLKMTGCKSFWSIMTCLNVVKSVNLGKGGIRFKSWPSFMNEFPSLESLRIENENVHWWSDLGLTINQLPSTLINLSLIFVRQSVWSCNLSGDIFFTIPRDCEIFPLDQHLSHLEVLEIVDFRAISFDWVSHCPPSLTRLNISHWRHNLSLPPSLIHFKSDEGVPTGFPSSLESLSCDQYPHTLPRLTSLSTCLGNDAWVQNLASLPQSLTNLDVFDTLPSSTWAFLPANLQSLSLCFFDPDSAMMSTTVNPVSGEVHRFETCPLELLPKSLTKLHIDGIYGLYLFVSGSCSSSLFPPQLKSFDAPFLRLAPNAAKQLPASLTHLSTSHFYEQLCSHLPQGLTSLSFNNVLLSPKTIQCLPKSITKLNSHFSEGKSKGGWIDYTTGKLIPLSSLPEYSVHNDYASYFGCLPPNLTSVDLYNFRELQDDFIQNQNFSNLLSLTLRGIDQLTDACIPLLNRHLTSLRVGPSPHITGKCFKSLPRSLTYLRLGSSSIFDEDIQHLPRTLQDIWISSAIELSDGCIRDFPRGCKRLSVSWNRKISQRCIPDLPLSMKSFFLANWRWINGEVYSE